MAAVCGMSEVTSHDRRFVLIYYYYYYYYYYYPCYPLIQGIYNYIPATNHVPRAHSVAAVLYLEFVLHVMLFRQ